MLCPDCQLHDYLGASCRTRHLLFEHSEILQYVLVWGFWPWVLYVRRAPLTEEQIDQLVNFMDLDSEGMVEYEEFLDSFIPVDSYCSVPGGLPSPPDAPADIASGATPNGGSSAKSAATQPKGSAVNQKPAAVAASTAKGSKQPMEVDDGPRRFTFSSQLGNSR